MPCAALVLSLLAALPSGPVLEGNPEAAILLGPWLDGAMRSTEAFGAWPEGAWSLRLHEEDADYERATGAPSGRFACWVGSTLHLVPWDRLRHRDVGALLRHELVHRRLRDRGLPRWREEAWCLWAEDHTQPPGAWPEEPDGGIQKRLDLALLAGTTASQRWAYAWLRAWIDGKPLPALPGRAIGGQEAWGPEAGDDRRPTVVWPPERLPRTVRVNGRAYSWRPSARFCFEGRVQFGAGMPVSDLEGRVTLEGISRGWRLSWTTDPDSWIAAATEGELGRGAPFEAKRALAAVLRAWFRGHSGGVHPDGSFCPLTHCAVVRGAPTREGLRAVAEAPEPGIDPERAFFTGSKGGVSWSPREAWGRGPDLAGGASRIPGDRWLDWSRMLSPAQVRRLKASVKPGLLPGQRGMHLGASGPYAVEALRLEAGRQFGWTTWPSNACEGRLAPDGSLVLEGHGWGHNVGLCLATALHRARQGDRAETILQEAFGAP